MKFPLIRSPVGSEAMEAALKLARQVFAPLSSSTNMLTPFLGIVLPTYRARATD